MNPIQYITMTANHFSHAGALVVMMTGLYSEDPSSANPDPARFPHTVAHFLAQPEQGRIILILPGDAPLGYAILIPFWSNEYGGTVLLIDELYVRPDSRSQGLASGLFEYVKRERPFDPVAIMLEVSPKNVRARKLYESLGFTERPNFMLVQKLSDANT